MTQKRPSNPTYNQNAFGFECAATHKYQAGARTIQHELEYQNRTPLYQPTNYPDNTRQLTLAPILPTSIPEWGVMTFATIQRTDATNHLRKRASEIKRFERQTNADEEDVLPDNPTSPSMDTKRNERWGRISAVDGREPNSFAGPNLRGIENIKRYNELRYQRGENRTAADGKTKQSPSVVG